MYRDFNDITAVIPVRAGSVRCVNKNIRPFGDTNLLKLKIATLKRVDRIKTIIVSSESEEMLKLAEEYGAIPMKRDPKYCSSECSGSDMRYALSQHVDTKYMLYTTVVSPFITVETYNKCIDMFCDDSEYDSIMTARVVQDFLLYNGKPVNYTSDFVPRSQDLPKYHVPTFGVAILSTEHVRDKKVLIGDKPFFLPLNELESMDIDTQYDFTVARLLYSNNYLNIEDINNSLK